METLLGKLSPMLCSPWSWFGKNTRNGPTGPCRLVTNIPSPFCSSDTQATQISTLWSDPHQLQKFGVGSSDALRLTPLALPGFQSKGHQI